jgi:hypothetical protein
MSENLPFTNLDFDNVKDNLKDYLKSQSQFQDYDFEGSNINVLLDILAYNTFQNNFYTNMAISEMFLDSAELKDSVVSHAKELNYLPRSRRSAYADINLEVFPADSPASISLPKRSEFTARCGTQTFKFYTDQSYLILPSQGSYSLEGIRIFEGKYVDEYIRVSDINNQRFIISNKNVDTTSIRVYIRENETSEEEVEYVFRQNIFGVNSSDEVFYLQPYIGDTYEIIFGQNVFGAAPSNGNVIRVEYRTCNGTEANGITTISISNRVNGNDSSTSIIGRTIGGTERESLQSIKYFAPKSIQVQNRAVTTSDYEILVKNNFPEIKTVSAYGGENLFPPQFGRVVIAVDSESGEGVSNNTRNAILSYLSERSAIAIDPIVVNSKFMFLSVSSIVYYNQNFTRKSPSDISESVINAVTQYSFNNLEEYKKDFKYSNLSSTIDNSDRYITSNDTTVIPFMEIQPRKNLSSYFILQYANEIVQNKIYNEQSLNDYAPGVYSSPFTFGGLTCFIQDDGNSNLNIVRRESGTNNIRIVEKNIGTVNYSNGDVILRYITIEDYPSGGVKVFAKTQNKKILAPFDRIMQIRSADVQINVRGVRE